LAMTMALALAGCGDDVSGDPDAAMLTPDASEVDAGEDASSCLDAGDACGDSGECCSGVCESDICVAPYGECSSVTKNCEVGAECCSGNCAPNDKCVATSDQCLDTGSSCNGHYQCCGGTCGNGVCTEPFGICLFTGVACSENAQCCSGICAGTCQMGEIAAACVNLGNACTLGVSTCCNGGQCQNSTCVLKAGDCRPQDSGCTDSFECCTGFCSSENICTAPPE
jgi:hypothetical protein